MRKLIITVEEGTNVLIKNDIGSIKSHVQMMITEKWKKGIVPIFWDGKAINRIVNKLLELYA